ncbi:MAG: hypothetical protein BM565_04600 [Gammaproteobacteria bacterium MedPE]|nr:MAG: hypothetical protein BM565_04600 [Gammaproteobacteria bacterium MedPE]
MMKKTQLLALSALFTSLFTQAASHHKLVFINQYDANQDWSLSLAEFDKARESRFNITDENNDGFVDESEYVFEYKNRMDNQLTKDRQGQIKQTIIRFNALDKNENARIDLAEYQGSGKRTFTYFDTNKDGVISESDPAPKRRAKKAEKTLTATQQRETQIKKLPRAKRVLSMPTTHSFNGLLTKYDANDDKTITPQEIAIVRQKIWDLADENNDGWISEQEYLYEFEDRMDMQIAKTRKSAVKQTYVRFGILDKDKDGKMTLAEYQASGHRSFNRFDTDNNQIVTLDEAMPKSYSKKKGKKNVKKQNVASNTSY